jgi:hypothetical protein
MKGTISLNYNCAEIVREDGTSLWLDGETDAGHFAQRILNFLAEPKYSPAIQKYVDASEPIYNRCNERVR